MKLSNRPDVLARLSRGDANMPDYDGFTIAQQLPEVKFEAAVNELLHVHYLLCENKHPANNPKAHVLSQSATIRAVLFNFNPPLKFSVEWLLERLFEQKPESLPVPVAPTRHFCIALCASKIHATIKNIGDMIGWEDDQNTVSPRTAAAKQSLLSLIPHITPQEISNKPTLYRLVLDHGDFGIHNMSITDECAVTSVFDWETGCIVPAILSDGSYNATPAEYDAYMKWATQYINVLYEKTPEYKTAIQAGKDARSLWFALRRWRGDDPEDYFGALGAWTETRIKELAVGEENLSDESRIDVESYRKTR
ncbi:hypothetical protein IL306_012539 [Fusarium sp. DS 682]|nr:hypothetical protein IL306_012539 [Fusarium sp. DS 682]